MEKAAEFVRFQFTVSGKAQLMVKNGAGGEVSFRLDAADGSELTNGKIFGDSELIDRAWQAGRATLATLGKKLPVTVTAKISTIGYVTVDSALVLRAMIPLAKPAL